MSGQVGQIAETLAARLEEEILPEIAAAFGWDVVALELDVEHHPATDLIAASIDFTGRARLRLLQGRL